MNKETECINPYEKIKEIEGKLNILEKEEIELREQIRKKINKSNNQNRLNECESEQLFLIIEQNCMQTAINWFEIYVLGYRKAEEISNNQQGQLRKQNPLDFQNTGSADMNEQSLIGAVNIRDKDSHLADNTLGCGNWMIEGKVKCGMNPEPIGFAICPSCQKSDVCERCGKPEAKSYTDNGCCICHNIGLKFKPKHKIVEIPYQKIMKYIRDLCFKFNISCKYCKNNRQSLNLLIKAIKDTSRIK